MRSTRQNMWIKLQGAKERNKQSKQHIPHIVVHWCILSWQIAVPTNFNMVFSRDNMGPQLFRGKNVDAARVVPVLDDLHRLWGERGREGGRLRLCNWKIRLVSWLKTHNISLCLHKKVTKIKRSIYHHILSPHFPLEETSVHQTVSMAPTAFRSSQDMFWMLMVQAVVFKSLASGADFPGENASPVDVWLHTGSILDLLGPTISN